MIRHDDPPRLFYFALCSLLAITTGAIAELVPDLPPLPRAIAGLSCLVFIAAGSLQLLRWMYDAWADNHHVLVEDKLKTPEWMIITAMHALSPEAVMYLNNRRTNLVLINGVDEEHDYFAISTMLGLVPLEFAREYFDYNDPINLRPIHYYSEGALWKDGHAKRDYAHALIKHCAENQWCSDWAGNQGARWLPSKRAEAMYRLHLTDSQYEELKG